MKCFDEIEIIATFNKPVTVWREKEMLASYCDLHPDIKVPPFTACEFLDIESRNLLFVIISRNSAQPIL